MKTLKYLACIVVTLILSIGMSWLIFQQQGPKYYGVEKVVLTRVSMQDGQKEKTVTDLEDIAKIVDAIRSMEISSSMATITDVLIGVPGYRFEFYMTDGTTYSCSHVPGNDGRGFYSDSEGHEIIVQMGSAELWRIMNYEEVSINP